jgi:hypothetical protein
VNTQTFTPAHLYSKFLTAATVVVALQLFVSTASAEWAIDLSRRQKETRHADMYQGPQEVEQRAPASVQPMFGEQPEKVNWVAPLPPQNPVVTTTVDSTDHVTEVVILNTPKGFVPNTVRMRKGVKYQVHVVNVNEKEKNISFVLDGFSEHQSTYYGKIKSFYLQPTREGVYSFQCPETSIEGRLVVFAPPGANNLRAPASAEVQGSSVSESVK